MGKAEQGVRGGQNRYKLIPRTLTFVTWGDRLLLLKGGPRKRLWSGKYNGLGGHVERGEEIYAAARREVQEEAGLEIELAQLRGIVNIDAGDPECGIVLFVFLAQTHHPALVTSEEGSLEWHRLSELPLSEMVEDLPLLLPKVLAQDEPPFFALYTYDQDDHLVIRWNGIGVGAEPH